MQNANRLPVHFLGQKCQIVSQYFRVDGHHNASRPSPPPRVSKDHLARIWLGSDQIQNVAHRDAGVELFG